MKDSRSSAPPARPSLPTRPSGIRRSPSPYDGNNRVPGLAPGDTLLGGRYRICGRLGAGGMGVVYEAYDSLLETTVALKTLTLVDARAIYQLKGEFRSLADVVHPNLVRFHELHADAGRWFFTMSLVDGRPFVDHVRAPALNLNDTLSLSAMKPAAPNADQPANPEPRLPHPAAFDEKALRDCLRQLALGVDAIHRAGKLHRDLKPSNVLVTPQGDVVILDFGLVSETPEVGARGRTLDEGLSGTPAYMAPEQCRDEALTPAADWYAVGVILFQALTGDVPFEGHPLQLMSRKQTLDAPEPKSRVLGIPEDLNRLCADLLARDPARRPRGVDVLERVGADVTSQLTLDPTTGVAATATAPHDHKRPFVGRESELAALSRSLRAVKGGAPCVTLVVGASGIGKTALVERFLHDIQQEPDIVVLSGRCYEREAVPYKAFDGVIDALTRHLRRLPDVRVAQILPRNVRALCRLFPVLERVNVIARAPKGDPLPSDPQELRRLGFTALKELFRRLTEASWLVLTVDDLQWGDMDSFHLLDSILAPPDPPGLLFVGTCRNDEAERGPLVSKLLDAMQGLQHVAVRTISVEPLGLPEVASLVRQLRPVNETLGTQAIHAESGGNPFLVSELVRYASDASTNGARVAVRDAFAARFASLPGAAQRLLEVLALAGRPVDRATAAAACGTDKAAVTEAFEVLRSNGLARAVAAADPDSTRRRLIAAYHDRIRAVVSDGLSDDERRKGHIRLGEALEKTGTADPETLIHHFLEAGDSRRVGRYARDAAERARSSLAFDRAAALYRIAVEHGDSAGDERLSLQVQLAEALVLAGRDAESAEAFLSAAMAASARENTRLRLDCRRRAAAQLVLSGELERGMHVLSDVLAEVGVGLPKNPRRAIAALLWDRFLLRMRGLSWTKREEAELSAEELALLEAYRVVVITLGLVHPIYALQLLTRYVLLSLRAGSPSHVAHALSQYGGMMANTGHAGYVAGQAYRRGAREAARHLKDDEALWLAVIAGQDGLAALLHGDFAEAREQLSLSVREIERAPVHFAGQHLGGNLLRLILFGALYLVGDLAELAAQFDTTRRDAIRRGDRYTEATVTRMSCVVWLMRDRPAEARAALEAVNWAPLQAGFHLQAGYDLRARVDIDLYEAAPVDIYARHAEAFRAFDRSLVRRLELDRLLMTHRRARIWLHNAEYDIDRTRALRGASRLSRDLLRADPDYAKAWGALVVAAIEWQKGNIAASTEWLRKAIGLHEATGMPAGPARFRLGQLLGGPEGAALCEDALTWARSQGIVKPEKYFRLTAPGFEHREVRQLLPRDSVPASGRRAEQIVA